MLKGPIEILNGQKIQSSVGGTPVVFANDIVVSGSIDITGTIEGINLTDFSSSLNTRLGNLESSGGSLNSFTASAISRLNSLESTTSSLNSYTSSNNTRLNTIESTTGSLNSYTSSTNTKLSSIETTTSSIISVNTTQNSRLDSLETTSGSILSTNTAQSSRLDSIEGKTGSYATTGSNIFQGTQTITGSLYISQDLVVAGSSSIQNISSSIVNIADNIITVNALNPSVRFGGLAVIDSGSNPQVSGSMLFDSVNNQWIFVHQNQGTVTSSVLLMGPETYDNLGNEAYITTNRLVKSTGIEHLTNSNINDDGTTVTILSNAVVNGTFSATGTTLVSGSSQINHNTTTNYVANEHINHTSVSISAGNGLSGGGDISSTRTLSLDTTSTTFTNGVKTKMNTEGVVSGSSQITYGSISGIPSGIVSGSSQVSYTGLSNIPSGIVSGSSQVSFTGLSNIPGGIVSGSVQVDLTSTTNYSTGIKTRLNAEGVISGSSQVTGIGNSQLTNSSFFVGTTSISLGRASASQTLTGVSIDGNAATVTDGAYLSSNNTLTGQNIFANTSTDTLILRNTEAMAADRGPYLTLQGNDGVTSRAFGQIAALKENATSGNYAGKLIFYVRPNGSALAEALSFASNKNATFAGSINGLVVSSGTITTGTWNGTAIGNSYLANSSFFIGTTSISLGRASASQTLTGVSIDGNAATATSASSASSATNSTQLGGYSLDGATSVATRIFNNKGQNHSTYTNFNTIMTPGPNYIQGPTNGPTGTAGGQWYGFMFGLGAEYGTSTGSAGHYASQLYYSRISQDSNQYLWARDMEGGSWGSWRKLYAGYADTAGTAGNITSYTINQNLGTSNTVQFGSLGVGVSPALTVHFRGSNEMVRFENTSTSSNQYCQLNMRAGNRNGYIWIGNENTSSWAGAGGLNIYTDNGNVDLWTNAVQRVRIQTDGHMVPFANNTYDLGSASLGWRNVYTNDLHLSNMNKPEGNDVDGTKGNWTIQEGAENLYIINNNNGKKFKISLEEV